MAGTYIYFIYIGVFDELCLLYLVSLLCNLIFWSFHLTGEDTYNQDIYSQGHGEIELVQVDRISWCVCPSTWSSILACSRFYTFGILNLYVWSIKPTTLWKRVATLNLIGQNNVVQFGDPSLYKNVQFGDLCCGWFGYTCSGFLIFKNFMDITFTFRLLSTY